MSNARDKANIPALNFSSTGIDDNATSTAITIDSSENIGIGTANPNNYTNYKTLTLNGSTGGVIDFTNNGTLIGEIFNDSDKLIIQSTNTNPIVVKTNGSERMRIDSSGNVGIGTSSPANELDVNGSIRISQDGGVLGNGDEKIKFDATGQTLQFQTADTERMRITSAGKVLINTTVSDNGNVTSSGDGTSGNGACYGLVRSSFRATLGMTSVGDMSIRNYSGEIYVQDSANNITTISPHNFSVIPDGVSEDLAWSYYARKGDTENDFDNTKYISADITKVIRKVENLTGEKLIYSGTGSTDDGSTVSQNIIQDLITRIESLEAEVTALKNQP